MNSPCQFSSAIHTNGSISDIIRFCYFESFLGVLANSITGLPLSLLDYLEAIELLNQRCRISPDAH